MKVKPVIILIVILFSSFILYSQDTEDPISKGDSLFSEMKDMTTAKEALAIYQKAIATEVDQYEVFWRISRIQYYIGQHSESKKEKKVIFSQGVYYAQKAIDLQPDKPDGHYWHGVNNGKFGEVKGVLKSLALVKPIKAAMNKVLELDRAYEDGGADRVLGRVYKELPGFAGGSKEKSLEHLLKSKELGPEDALTRYYLADTYLSLKRIDEAREELEYILNMEDDPRWVIGIQEAKEDAKKLLENKKFKNK